MSEWVNPRDRAWALAAIIGGIVLLFGVEVIDQPDATAFDLLIELISITPIVMTSVGVALLFQVVRRQRDDQARLIRDLEIAPDIPHEQLVLLALLEAVLPEPLPETVDGPRVRTAGDHDAHAMDTSRLCRGGRGQPATKLVINPDSWFSIGLNVDRDHITMVLLDFEGEVRARASREVNFALPKDVEQFFRKGVGKLLDKVGIGADRLAGIGVALPDDMPKAALPQQPANYGIWNSTDVAALLKEALPVPVFCTSSVKLPGTPTRIVAGPLLARVRLGAMIVIAPLAPGAPLACVVLSLLTLL